MGWTPKSTATTLRFVVVVVFAALAVAVAVVAAFRITVSHLLQFQHLGFADLSMAEL
jgi:hypothetical protein